MQSAFRQQPLGCAGEGRETHREFGAFRGVSASQADTVLAEHRDSPRHHLEQLLLHQRIGHQRHGDESQRIARHRVHRVKVVQRVVRGDAAEPVGIIDHGAEGIAGRD